ncbi:MAG: hypothetical protein U5L02_16410 [Rheinheimera sp.]|nr:hypothetical protein [Rheinheimera sp.]
MSMFPTTERIQVEIAVAMSIREQYGTNQPGKTYEDGIAEALLWVLGGEEPQNFGGAEIDINLSNISNVGDSHEKQYS